MDIIKEPMNYALSPTSAWGGGALQILAWVNYAYTSTSLVGIVPNMQLVNIINIFLSKYFHRKQTLELTRYNYRCI